MKKLFLISAGLLIACFAQAQPVSDNAIIPIGVTLNSILRLQVLSGGNIEFVVSTMKDYTDGINAGGTNSRYQTKFNVASSVDYSVDMFSEEGALISTDLAAGAPNIPLENIGYQLLDGAGLALPAADATHVYVGAASVVPLKDVPDGSVFLIECPAGDAAANSFTLAWRLGTQEGSLVKTSLLTGSFAAGRYSTNAVLVLAPN